MFTDALLFAADKHKLQSRKGSGLPYITHPISVAHNVRQFKKSKNIELLMTAALLHDVVEDCDVTLGEIAERFGYKIASIVEELTSDPEKIKEIGKLEYLKQKFSKISTYGLVIKLSDRLDNVSDMNNVPDKFREKVFNETKLLMEYLESNVKLTETHKKLIAEIKNKIVVVI